jgi:oligoribonuclease
MPDPRNDRLVWIDCEMTGLDPEHDVIVEVAAIVTDGNLNELDEGISLVIRPDDLKVLDGMEQVVVDMHRSSGLLEEIPAGISTQAAQAAVLEYLLAHSPDPRRSLLAGSSIYVDRGFLARYMPEVDAHMHYRLIDVSSIKELARRWYPRAYFNAPAKTGNHRALADIRESIAELRYYRSLIFVPEPGPTTDEARAAAAEHTVIHDR